MQLRRITSRIYSMKYLDIFLQVSIFYWMSAPSRASDTLRAGRVTRFKFAAGKLT
ncbi:MAG: hypothetical protein ACTTKX_05035 [Treponema sp.]